MNELCETLTTEVAFSECLLHIRSCARNSVASERDRVCSLSSHSPASSHVASIPPAHQIRCRQDHWGFHVGPSAEFAGESGIGAKLGF